jgi:hypothetical protein
MSDEMPKLKTQDVIMWCLVRAIAHPMGTSEYRGIVESQLGWESWRNSERNMFN